MSLVEKVAILGSLVGIGGLGVYHFINSNRTYKSKIRR